MLYCRFAGLLTHRSRLLPPLRLISNTARCAKKDEQLPARPTLPDHELHYVFLKGSGPGGQKINKTSSACQITHIPTGTVVKSQATRSKSQNYTIARRILAEKVELLQKGDESRVVKQAEKAAKKKASADKKKRRKYKSINEPQDSDAEVEEEPADGDNHNHSTVRDGTASKITTLDETKH